jgi:ubiquinone/menaquinone biosynthesis C-methylase UbiE
VTVLPSFEFDVPGVSEEVAPEDKFAAMSGIENYLASGQWSFRGIRLAMAAAKVEALSNILDLPCGYGRVIRILRAAFPDARLTACDINPSMATSAQRRSTLRGY